MMKKPTPTPAPADEPEAPVQYRVIGPAKGLRRAGLQFGREPVILSGADLTEAQLAMLRAEPLLTVTEEPGVPAPVVDLEPPP